MNKSTMTWEDYAETVRDHFHIGTGGALPGDFSIWLAVFDLWNAGKSPQDAAFTLGYSLLRRGPCFSATEVQR